MENTKIFVSYSRKDLDKVKRIVELINDTLHLRCWLDLEGIDCTGPAFREVIIDAIDRSDLVLFMFSENSLQSEFTKKEVLYAKGVGKKIIPINIDNAEMSGWFRFEFAGVDCIDFTREEQREKLFRNVADMLNIKVSQEEMQRVRDFKLGRKLLPILLGVLAVLLCLVGGVAAWKFMPTSGDDPQAEIITMVDSLPEVEQSIEPVAPQEETPKKAMVPTNKDVQQKEAESVVAEKKIDSEVVKEQVGQQPKVTAANNVLHLGYADWNGGIKNGKAHDVDGKMTFIESHEIESRDPKHRVAEAGDYVEGEYVDGHLVQGVWYDKDNNKKGSIIIGR